VGADGVIFVLRDEEDFRMRIYNSDGSEPEVSFVFQILQINFCMA
jgi:diaminopimelate epimerase